MVIFPIHFVPVNTPLCIIAQTIQLSKTKPRLIGMFLWTTNVWCKK